MKYLISKKLSLLVLGFTAIVMAGTIKDIQKHANIAVDSNSEPLEIIPIERNLASEEEAKVAQLDLPPNRANIKKINTTWEITRVVGADEKVLYDKMSNSEDAKNMITIPLELIGRGLVKVNNDTKQIYRVSLLSDFGTIAIFKKLGKGYKIIEAKKTTTTNESNSSLEIAENSELILERALNPSRSNKVLTNDEVSGQVTLNTKSLSNLRAELKSDNGETQIIDIDSADLMEDGTFKTVIGGDVISGVVFNNGKAGYRLTFITGPLAGAILDFTTKESIESSKESELINEGGANEASTENSNALQSETQENILEAGQEASEPVQNEKMNKFSFEVVQQGAEQVITERIKAAEDTI
jgi:hypothetical protein